MNGIQRGTGDRCKMDASRRNLSESSIAVAAAPAAARWEGADTGAADTDGGRHGLGRLGALLAAAMLLTATPGSAQTWSAVPSNVGGGLVDAIFTSAFTAVAVGAANGGNGSVTVSGDGGVTWTQATSIANADVNAVFSAANTIIAVGADKGGGADELIHYSRDRAATVAWVNPTPIGFHGAPGDSEDGIFIDNKRAVGVGTGSGPNLGNVILTQDAGASWSVPFVANEILRAVASSGVIAVAVGENQGGGPNTETIIRSGDSGVTWGQLLTAALPDVSADLLDVVFVNATTVVAVGGDVVAPPSPDGQVLLSTDSGVTWTNPLVAPLLTTTLNAVDSSSGDIVVAVADGGSIARSTDAGATWVSFASGTLENLRTVLFLTSSVVLAAGANGTITGSIDGGLTWTEQIGSGGGTPQPTTSQIEALAYNSDNRVIAVGACRCHPAQSRSDQHLRADPLPEQVAAGVPARGVCGVRAQQAALTVGSSHRTEEHSVNITCPSFS